ncbi:MAG: Hsp20/alpha crystallin family protein [Desulfovibrionaceae bacterium]|jgi:HSP20 family protein|nr:Hsp20/alpha crystallin family protein [Desulfovibrionaceae bacterium]
MIIDYTPFDLLHREMSRLLGGIARPYEYALAGVFLPQVNLSEDEDNFYLDAELPGVAREDLEITLTSQGVVIRGERKTAEGGYFRNERPSGKFTRSVHLSAPVDRDKVSAHYADGVLSVTLPKAETFKPRKIAIES